MKTILLTGGGTAGHCIPNIALLPQLKKHFDNIYYIGSKNGIEKKLIEEKGITYFPVECGKLRRSFTVKNLGTPFKVIAGINQAGKIIDKIKPDVIFSKGGYVAVPTVIAGHKRNIPIISHESDLTIGLANKFTAKFCKKVLTSFPETAELLTNGIYTGSPIRDELLKTDKQNALKRLGLKGLKPIILVTGGSQGAQAINKTLKEALPELLKDFEILHICGKGNLNKGKLPNGYYQKEFILNMEDAFAVADVCISRAGANTIFEILASNKPSVLIPLPKISSRGDQILNAEYFYKKGLVHILNQELLTKESIILAINSAYSNREKISAKIKKFNNQNANKKICEIILSYTKH